MDPSRRFIQLLHWEVDGERFTAQSPELHYAEGKNLRGDSTLYAAQSFAEMPDGIASVKIDSSSGDILSCL
jgi:hypothetical protein